MVVNNANSIASLSQMPTIQRIRSMAWCPLLRLPESKLEYRVWERGKHILTIALDDGSIHILEVLSPFNADSSNWQCEKLCGVGPNHQDFWEFHHAAAYQDDEHSSSKNPHRPSLFGIAMKTSRFVDGLHFTPWISRDAQFHETVINFRAGTFASSLNLVCETIGLEEVRFRIEKLGGSLHASIALSRVFEFSFFLLMLFQRALLTKALLVLV